MGSSGSSLPYVQATRVCTVREFYFVLFLVYFLSLCLIMEQRTDGYLITWVFGSGSGTSYFYLSSENFKTIIKPSKNWFLIIHHEPAILYNVSNKILVSTRAHYYSHNRCQPTVCYCSYQNTINSMCVWIYIYNCFEEINI